MRGRTIPRPRWRGKIGAFRASPLLAVVAILLTLSAVAGLVLAYPQGLAGRSQTAGDGQGVSLRAALLAGGLAAAPVAPGNWTPVFALGFAPRLPIDFPGPEYLPPPINCSLPPKPVTGSGPIGPEPPCPAAPSGATYVPLCNWTGFGTVNLSSNDSFVVPSISGSVGGGLATLWLITYRGVPDSTLLVTVLGGAAVPYALLSGPGCGFPPGGYGSLGADVIDSTVAAAVVDAWGGTAFLANESGASATYAVSASFTFSFGFEECNGSTGGTNSSGGITGGCTNFTRSYTWPATWGVGYSCYAPGSGPCSTPASLFAELNASTGMPISIVIELGGFCSWLPGYFSAVCPVPLLSAAPSSS